MLMRLFLGMPGTDSKKMCLQAILGTIPNDITRIVCPLLSDNVVNEE